MKAMQVQSCEGCPMRDSEGQACNHPDAPKANGHAPPSWDDEYSKTWQGDPPSDHGWAGGIPKLCPLRREALMLGLSIEAMASQPAPPG